MAQRFNHLYGEHFVLPEAAIDEAVATLPGLDGRKMSKSYDNTIPLFAPREQLRKQIAAHRHRLARAGRAQGQVEGSALFQIYQAFASAEETAALRQAYADGIALGRRQAAAVRAHRPRDRADARALRRAGQQPGARSKTILRAGADKARALCRRRSWPNCAQAVGLRNLASSAGGTAKAQAPRRRCRPSSSTAKPTAVTTSSWWTRSGRLLAQSAGFDSPQEAGRAIAQLKQTGSAAA